MKKDEVKQYLGRKVKIILKESGNIYQGEILELMEDSLVILDKFDEEVTIDYEMVGLVTPLKR